MTKVAARLERAVSRYHLVPMIELGEIMSKTSEAAQKLLDMIQLHHDTFEMKNWADYNQYMVKQNFPEEVFPEIKLENIEEGNTTCGTTLCIAGFAALASGWKQSFRKTGFGVVDVMVSPEGEERNPNYVKLGADFLDLPHELAADLFLTTDNTTALGLLTQLAEGEDPNEILRPIEGECYCDECYPDVDDEEDW